VTAADAKAIKNVGYSARRIRQDHPDGSAAVRLRCHNAHGRCGAGNTVTDFDEDEIKRKISINCATAPVKWKGVDLTFVDTPGTLTSWVKRSQLCGLSTPVVS